MTMTPRLVRALSASRHGITVRDYAEHGGFSPGAAMAAFSRLSKMRMVWRTLVGVRNVHTYPVLSQPTVTG